jgi:hypothetical protein
MEEIKEIVLPHTINLKYPVTFGAETVDKLVFKRRLIVADMMELPVQNLKFGDFVKIISNCTAQSKEFIKQMDTQDMMECIEVMTYFLGSSAKTGEE